MYEASSQTGLENNRRKKAQKTNQERKERGKKEEGMGKGKEGEGRDAYFGKPSVSYPEQ